ncbi:MAG: alginate export family protein [Pseudomonadota bacterium]
MAWSRQSIIGAGVLGLLALPGPASAQSFSGEARLRWDGHNNAQLKIGNDYQQVLFRGVVGADWEPDPHLRLFGQVATGQLDRGRGAAPPNFQNDAALQQLFAELRVEVGGGRLGAIIGRQEFADGPRQLLSLSDGPNIHRSWNGGRVYFQSQKMRLGAFELRATRQGGGAFDEGTNHAERITGLNASLALAPELRLDPFWIQSANPSLRSGGRIGPDARDTFGVRLWGRQGDVRFDWTLAHQRGRDQKADAKAWGLFAVQSLALSGHAWKPRLTSHVDLASGGSYGNATFKGFNQLYASSAYLGEGQFLSLSNLFMIAPGIAIAPTPRTALALEYGFARRLSARDAAYAGGMRPYAGTQNISGRPIGGLLRGSGSWSATKQLTLFVNLEHFRAGALLRRAQFGSGSYVHAGATWRY